MSKGTKFPIIICDKDACVAASGIPKKEVLERRVSSQLEEIFEKRTSFVLQSGEHREFFPLEGIEHKASVAIPIISSGDVIGAVCLIMQENGAVPEDTDVKIASVAASFLGKQMEE